jgi:membrane protease YdiL (CAAX protease family)
VAATITMTLSPFSSEFLPGIAVADDRIAVLVLALVVGLTAGIFEEVGWTGFAIPRLTRRYGVLVTGLIVGLLWSLWHVPVAIWGMGDRAGTIPLVVFLVVDGLAGLPAFRVLMVRVYDRTGSLFLAMLMHVSITTTVLTLTPRTTGLALLAYGLAFAAAIWLVVAAMTLVSGWQVPRNQVRRRAA